MPPLILDPQQVPSVPWTSAMPTLPEWSVAQWCDLSAERIGAALTQSDQVEGLWAHDASFSRGMTPAAVLVLLIATESGFEVLMTTRALHLRHHPGQVSFVGGRLESGETAILAALREANEEINLNTQSVKVLGVLPNYRTISGFSVTPVVALMSQSDWQAQSIRVDAQEVDQVFCVPLKTVLDRQLMRLHRFEYAGGHRQFLSVTHSQGGQTFFIWGASMAILHNFDLVLRSQWSAAD